MRASSPAWLFRCARNHVINFLRTQRRRRQREGLSLDAAGDPALTLHAPGRSPDAYVLASWSLDQVARAVWRLSPVQREAVLGYYLVGLSAPVPADTLHSSPHALQQTLFRARQRLRDMLA